MRVFAFLSSFAAVILLLATSVQAQNEVADMILVNANVFTASNAHPHAEAIAIKGEHILAVDTNQKISSLAGPKTKRIDVGGRLVIPGIMDA